MLVLTRKQEETLIIGDNIRIKVIEVSGNAVVLGIDAPKDIAIKREEIDNKNKNI